MEEWWRELHKQKVQRKWSVLRFLSISGSETETAKRKADHLWDLRARKDFLKQETKGTNHKRKTIDKYALLRKRVQE